MYKISIRSILTVFFVAACFLVVLRQNSTLKSSLSAHEEHEHFSVRVENQANSNVIFSRLDQLLLDDCKDLKIIDEYKTLKNRTLVSQIFLTMREKAYLRNRGVSHKVYDDQGIKRLCGITLDLMNVNDLAEFKSLLTIYSPERLEDLGESQEMRDLFIDKTKLPEVDNETDVVKPKSKSPE